MTVEPLAAGVDNDEVCEVYLDPWGVLVCCLADPEVDDDLALPNCRCATDLVTSRNNAKDISTKHTRKYPTKHLAEIGKKANDRVYLDNHMLTKSLDHYLKVQLLLTTV